MTKDDEDLMTPSEVARMFRVNPKTVTRWAQDRLIPTALRTVKRGGPLPRNTPLTARKPLTQGPLPRIAPAKTTARDTGPTRRVRCAVRERSGGLCELQDCCGGPAEHIHHRRPRGAGGSTAPDTNLPSNLLHLCAAGHRWIEGNRTAALAAGLLLKSGAHPAKESVLTRHTLGRVFLDDIGGLGGWRTA